jgi:pSer/pThr/pTyr-binding forkhead associated (FHA) protein
MSGNGGAAGERFEDRAVPPGAAIRVLRGFYEGLELPLDRDWLVIGRGRGADLVIHEPTISRAHAAVGFREGSFFVQDLGSTNGTFVNGTRRERAPLADGDEIQMGRLHLGVRLPQGTAAEGA